MKIRPVGRAESAKADLASRLDGTQKKVCAFLWQLWLIEKSRNAFLRKELIAVPFGSNKTHPKTVL